MSGIKVELEELLVGAAFLRDETTVKEKKTDQ
jgi:hypothetical protein